MALSIAQPQSLYGLLAEFESGEELVEATQAAYDAGYRKMDAYAPFPVEGLADALGFHKTRVPMMVLIGGIVGGLGGFALQTYLNAINYPINVGGRPAFSWPSFIPVTFETTVLLAALSAVLGMLALNGLPLPYHPLFKVPRFNRASQDRFFLCIEQEDPQFDPEATHDFLETLTPISISEVEP